MDHLSTLIPPPCTAFSFAQQAKQAPAVKKAVPHAPAAATVADGCELAAGQARTLHANELSVLRITHGRVWATLTDVGPYSRVPGGDHFLSRGQSLTLLPGQELVMEPFGIGHSSAAQFSWETACAEPIALPEPGQFAAGVRQPLHDLRQALGLVAGASGRLVQGLAAGAWGAADLVASAMLSRFAIIFVATRDRCTSTSGTFDTKTGNF